ncbi:CpsD/CapB family tyrosine-protein kinase [Halanaerobium hydrogeniformans]|uniref:non-specific protein-tyrosine kinase n=1 Tax=Halanaerobium hydrogeniformans TaxID=656519 RepID=E4RPJ5_HALHG|nr:CpsD/CapB family tyrosine-protein kinase [Halanaerobium hydrogeniformans]ADQ14018.1 capsular exopolysaccharide family [Halanaerobium hydrogeniformans]
MKKKNKKSELNSDKLVALHHIKSPATEAFRTIRTNLQFMSPDEDLKIIMITGAEKSVGKSTMASNLAITFAMTGNTTYLLDTDLRRPMLHQLFGLPNFQGLSSYLSGEKENLEELTAKCDQSGLYILPAGPIPPNPAEMLGSKRMSKVLENLQEKADIIIIDAPPILPVTDAVLLSQKVDGVIITAECNETRKDVFQKAQQRLEQVEANILGTILNKYPVNKSSYYTYENYYYYGEE